MRSNIGSKSGSPLGSESITNLIMRYATPAIISILVSAAYNVTDQIFIGHLVGMYGNAATNVAFPLSQFLSAASICIGVGTAANFNLNMGAKREDDARQFAGCGLALMAIVGVLIFIVGYTLMGTLIRAFGATEQIFPLAKQYMSITLFGMPLLLFTTACSNLIRADASPTYAMLSTISGALLNVFLDWLFMAVFKWGISGAALATVIGQILSFCLVIYYMAHFQTVKISLKDIRVTKKALGILKLGFSGFCNHFVMMLVQITMNNTFRYYGGISIYGSDIPLAVAGVVSKVNSIVLAFNVGTGQGCQPILGYNYGAKNYSRVRETYRKAATISLTMSSLFFVLFQLFPRAIVSIFGTGSDLYFQFAERYMRIFMLMMFVNGLQPITVNFFSSIGKASQGIFLSLTRQGLYLIPLLILLPMKLGIDGAVYAGPIADSLAVATCVIMANKEHKKLKALEKEEAITINKE